MAEEMPSLSERLLSLPDTLMEWEYLASTVHKLFAAIKRRRILRAILVLIIYAPLLFLVHYIVGLHEGLLPRSGLGYYFYNGGVSFLALLIAILLFSIPLLLIAHSDNRRKDLLLEVSRSLDLISQQVIHSGKVTVLPTLDEALETLITKVEEGAASNCILTRDAIYLLADKWKPFLQGHLLKSGPLTELDVAAKKANRFREALTSFTGELHMILPDCRDHYVKEFLHGREGTLHLPKNTLVNINQAAIDWILGDLRKTRKRARRNTYLHLTNRSPGFRFMLLDDVCYLQEFPLVTPGVREPIIAIERTKEPTAFAAIECGLNIISTLF